MATAHSGDEAVRSSVDSFAPPMKALSCTLRNPTRTRICRVESSVALRPALWLEEPPALRHPH
jgi:hypothetical protein